MEGLKSWVEKEEINVPWVTPMREIGHTNRKIQNTVTVENQ